MKNNVISAEILELHEKYPGKFLELHEKYPTKKLEHR